MTTHSQKLHSEWNEQWQRFDDDTPFLFFDWISPHTLEDFRDKTVIDAGCGPGHHIRLIAPVARHVLGIDLNTADIAETRLAELNNVSFVQADIARYRPETLCDILYCVGVIHHTDNPDVTFENLKACVRPGGLVIIWCYSHEGNALVRLLVEPVRKLVLRHLPRSTVLAVARLVTAMLYPFVYTIYRLPVRLLPFYGYFENFRKLSFYRNVLNVFDKLNAPQTQFIKYQRIARWFNADFEEVSISPYRGVSWRASGRRRE